MSFILYHKFPTNEYNLRLYLA